MKGKIYLDKRYKIDRALLLPPTKFNEKEMFYSERS